TSPIVSCSMRYWVSSLITSPAVFKVTCRFPVSIPPGSRPDRHGRTGDSAPESAGGGVRSTVRLLSSRGTAAKASTAWAVGRARPHLTRGCQGVHRQDIHEGGPTVGRGAVGHGPPAATPVAQGLVVAPGRSREPPAGAAGRHDEASD